MTDWSAAYRTLATAGYSDREIGELAGGLSRNIVNQVRNGTYKFKHDPGHEAGTRVLTAVAQFERGQSGDLPLNETEDI
jgi:hypothetical protein